MSPAAAARWTEPRRDDDARLVSDLISGDEDAFLRLVHREHASMIRYARLFDSTPASAEEVVQEAWVGMLVGLARFEGRSSLRSWMLGIVANRARSCGVREGRSVPVSAPTEDREEDATDPDRFFHPGSPQTGRASSVRRPSNSFARPSNGFPGFGGR